VLTLAFVQVNSIVKTLSPQYRTCLYLSLALTLTACSGAQLKQNNELDSVLISGNYRDAAMMAEQRMGVKVVKDPTAERIPIVYKPKFVLQHLEAAEAWRMAGDAARSIEHYDAAESALGDVGENVAGSVVGKVGASLINETLSTYMPSPAESILINYYKALVFWSAGKGDLARVELNRADDRTRRAVERYSKEIEAAQAQAEKQKSDQTYSNPKVSGPINAQFPEMAKWAPYAEFMVPPATYLHALYLASSQVPSDHEKALELYERLGGIVGEQATLKADHAEISGKGLCAGAQCVWVLIEQGQGPELQERKFSYAAFTGTGVVNVQMALPALVSRFDPALSQCAIVYQENSEDCQSFASMDRVIQTEFSKRFPGIVTRAVVSTVVKAVAQDQVAQQGGYFAGLAASIVTGAITTADIRMWRAMPSAFTLNRFNRNGSRKLVLEISGHTVEVELSETGNQLVHVKAPVAQIKPVVTIVNL